MMKRPVINEELCTGCGVCVDECPNSCLELKNDVSVLVRPEDCTGSESCAEACPSEAITMEENK